jgi:hypothetical protein
MAKKKQPDPSFGQELHRLEREVEVPIVPGEFRSWQRNVRARLEPLHDVWQAERAARHSTLDGILENDLALAQRVKLLEEREAEVGRELERLQAELLNLRRQITEDPTSSWEPDDEANTLREELLEWIVQARALEKEVDTWFLEAIHRDRGDGD